MSKKKNAMQFAGALLAIAGGAAATSWAINSFMRGSSPTMRSGVQLGLGAVPLIFLNPRMPLARYALMGTAVAGTLGLVERATGIQTLAGDAAGTLSAREIEQLQMMGALPRMMGPQTFRHMAGPQTMRSMAGGFKMPG